MVTRLASEQLPKKDPKLKRFIRNHHKLRRLNAIIESEQKAKKAQEEVKMATHPKAQVTPEYTDGKLAILINLQQKQIDDLRRIVYDLDEEVQELRNGKK